MWKIRVMWTLAEFAIAIGLIGILTHVCTQVINIHAAVISLSSALGAYTIGALVRLPNCAGATHAG